MQPALGVYLGAYNIGCRELKLSYRIYEWWRATASQGACVRTHIMPAFLRTRFLLALALTVGLACPAQQKPVPQPSVPDAPSAIKPPQPFPADAPRATAPPSRQPTEPAGESSSSGARESEATSAAPPAEGT